MRKFVKNFHNTFVFLKGHYIKYSLGMIGKTLIESTAVLMETLLLKNILDVGKPDSMRTILSMFAWLLLYVVVILCLQPLFTYWFNANAKYGQGNVNKAIYEKYGKLPAKYFEENHSGKLMSLLLSDSWLLAAIFMRHFRRITAAVITIIIYLIPMFVLDYRITIAMLTLNLLTLLVNMGVSGRMKGQTKSIQEKVEDMTIIISNMIGGMSVARMYHMLPNLKKQFREKNLEIYHRSMQRGNISAGLAAYNFAIYMINMMVFLLIGSWMVNRGLTTYGAIISIMSLETAMDENFREFATYYPEFFNGMAATERVCDFLNTEEEPIQWSNKEQPVCSEQKAYIEFRNVDFGYDAGSRVLSDFSLSIQKGEYVAIVGESGCGKSSISKLLLGFYPVNAGSIRIDGMDIACIPLEKLRQMIAYVPQEPMVFCQTIMENIRYGNPAASDAEVIWAARCADAYDFIMKQENGFMTLVGENGASLSGGQRQRIAIARAILKDAPIILLDEATSALDNETESRIVNVLNKYRKDKTIITIAHRSTSIAYVDRRIEIKKL